MQNELIYAKGFNLGYQFTLNAVGHEKEMTEKLKAICLRFDQDIIMQGVSDGIVEGLRERMIEIRKNRLRELRILNEARDKEINKSKDLEK